MKAADCGRNSRRKFQVVANRNAVSDRANVRIPVSRADWRTPTVPRTIARAAPRKEMKSILASKNNNVETGPLLVGTIGGFFSGCSITGDLL